MQTEKRSMTVSIRVTPDEKRAVDILADFEQRRPGDTLHRMLVADNRISKLIAHIKLEAENAGLHQPRP